MYFPTTTGPSHEQSLATRYWVCRLLLTAWNDFSDAREALAASVPAIASDTTDAQGAYQCHTTDVPVESQQVIVRDIDGNANGSYEDQMFEVKFTDGDQTASRKGWNMGTREKKVDITVIKK